MFDFAVPPEITSARIYAGPGPGSMITAAASWQALSAELEVAATGYRTVVTDLLASWAGPSSAAMFAAVTPYILWLEGTAQQARITGVEATAAATAFSTAFAMTVPPPVIAANRALLAALIATNFLGINAAAIAATEAEYMEMWSQDVAAMFEYAAQSFAAIGSLPQFMPAPPVASPAGTACQGAAVGQAAATSSGSTQSTVGGLLNGDILNNPWVSLFNAYDQAFISSAPVTNVTSIIALLALTEMGQMDYVPEPGVAPPVNTPTAEPVGNPAGAISGSASAAMGGSRSVGGLSVPSSWGNATAAERPPSILTTIGETPRYEVGVPVPPAVPVMGGRSDQERKKKPSPEYGPVSKVMPGRHPSAG